MRTPIIPDNLDEETAEHVTDMVAKALLARLDTSSTIITWDELERASQMKCALVQSPNGIEFNRSEGCQAWQDHSKEQH